MSDSKTKGESVPKPEELTIVDYLDEEEDTKSDASSEVSMDKSIMEFEFEESKSHLSSGSVNSNNLDEEDPWWHQLLKQFGGGPKPSPQEEAEAKKNTPPQKSLESVYDDIEAVNPENMHCKEFRSLFQSLKKDGALKPEDHWKVLALHAEILQRDLVFPAQAGESIQCKCTRGSMHNECPIWHFKACFLLKDSSQPYLSGLLQNEDISLKVWSFRLCVLFVRVRIFELEKKCIGRIDLHEILTPEMAVAQAEAEAKSEAGTNSVWRDLTAGDDVHLKEFSPKSPMYFLAILSSLLRNNASAENPIPVQMFQVLFEAMCGTPFPVITKGSEDPKISRDFPGNSKIEITSAFRLIAHLADGASKESFVFVMKTAILLLDPNCNNANAQYNCKMLLKQKDWYSWLTPILVRELKKEANQLQTDESSVDGICSRMLAAHAVQALSPLGLAHKSAGVFKEEAVLNAKLELALLAIPLSFAVFHENSPKKFQTYVLTIIRKLRSLGKNTAYMFLTIVVRRLIQVCERGAFGPGVEIPKFVIANLEILLNQLIVLAFFSEGLSAIHIDFVEEDSNHLPIASVLMDSGVSLLEVIEKKFVLNEHELKGASKKRVKAQSRILQFLDQYRPTSASSNDYFLTIGEILFGSHEESGTKPPAAKQRRKHKSKASTASFVTEVLATQLQRFTQTHSKSSATPTTSSPGSMLRKLFQKNSPSSTSLAKAKAFSIQLQAVTNQMINKVMRKKSMPESEEDLERAAKFFASRSTPHDPETNLAPRTTN